MNKIDIGDNALAALVVIVVGICFLAFTLS